LERILAIANADLDASIRVQERVGIPRHRPAHAIERNAAGAGRRRPWGIRDETRLQNLQIDPR